MCKSIHILQRSVGLLPQLLPAYNWIDNKFYPVIANRKQLRVLTTDLCFARVLLCMFCISPERFLIPKTQYFTLSLDDTRNVIITHLLELHISYLYLYIFFQDAFFDRKISNAAEIMCRLSSCAISSWQTPWVAFRLVKISPADLGTTRGPEYFVCCHGAAPLTRA